MTTNQTPVQRCQYCGSDDLGLGWQHGEALVTYKKHGLLGSRLRYLICRRCGAVLFRERNLRSKAVDLAFILVGMFFLWLGSRPA